MTMHDVPLETHAALTWLNDKQRYDAMQISV
jgi:hypothetical protein